MDDKIIATFCLCDDLLKAMHHQENRQCQMNDAEIMTTAFIASLFFRGNHESARAMLKQHGYIPHMVSKGRFSRRLHRIIPLQRCRSASTITVVSRYADWNFWICIA